MSAAPNVLERLLTTPGAPGQEGAAVAVWSEYNAVLFLVCMLGAMLVLRLGRGGRPSSSASPRWRH